METLEKMSDIFVGNNERCQIAELDEIAMILMGISDNMFSGPSVSISSRGTYFLQGESITASENTIKSIDFCCQRGYFADAFTLTRKYRDDIIQYVFVAQIVENMQKLDDEEFKKLYGSDLTVENLVQAIESEMKILAAGTRKSAADLAVELWVYDALEDEKYFKERKQYFDTSKYVAQLVKDEDIKQLMEIYLKDIWKETDRTLNNYVHGNGRKYILDNYPSYGDYQKRKQKLIETVHNITSIFISILSIALPNKIQSSDYRDDMELDITPREGCQYWVMPMIVEFMDMHFPKIHPDLLQFLEDNNKYGMKMLMKDYEE